jgi:hypothetical protein
MLACAPQNLSKKVAWAWAFWRVEFGESVPDFGLSSRVETTLNMGMGIVT